MTELRKTVSKAKFAQAMRLLGINPDVAIVHIAEGQIIATTFAGVPAPAADGEFQTVTEYTQIVAIDDTACVDCQRIVEIEHRYVLLHSTRTSGAITPGEHYAYTQLRFHAAHSQGANQ